MVASEGVLEARIVVVFDPVGCEAIMIGSEKFIFDTSSSSSSSSSSTSSSSAVRNKSLSARVSFCLSRPWNRG